VRASRTVCFARAAISPVSRSIVASACRPRARAAEIARTRLPTERRRSRRRAFGASPAALTRFASRVSRETAWAQRPESVGERISASTTVVSTRRRRERSTARSTASESSSSLSSSSSPGPSRFVSLISVEGSGTRPSIPIRQNRRHVNESETSLHSVS
jgi:hypothetical protein